MLFGQLLLAASRSGLVRRAVSGLPLTRKVVDRFVAGESAQDAVRATRLLAGRKLQVTIDHLGEETRDAASASAAAQAYVTLMAAMREAGIEVEASLKLSAVGQAFDEKMALEHAREIAAASPLLTLDMEDHTTVDSTLEILGELREDFPTTGVAVQAYLRRTEGDLRELSYPGSRVRLVKGAYREPPSVAFQQKPEVDLAYVRALRILMSGSAYPMVATHDDRLVNITELLADRFGKTFGDYEYQMLYGIRTDRQEALAAAGQTVRVYVPYGDDWYGYFMRRLAERPANVAFFLRALGGK